MPHSLCRPGHRDLRDGRSLVEGISGYEGLFLRHIIDSRELDEPDPIDYLAFQTSAI